MPAPDTHDVVWSVSVIEIETVPDAPAVTVIWFVPVPAVTEPPVTTQAYVTPETVGTEAVKERNGTTLAGAVTTGAAGVALIMTETVAELSVQGAFEIVHRNVIGPAPPVCVKVDVPLLTFEKVPVPPETTDHAPVPVVGVFPPKLAVVPLAQIVCPVPTVAVVGGCVTVIDTSAVEAGHSTFEIVHRNVIGPTPPVCVKVDVPLEAFEKVPVPPETTDHAPEPVVGVFPPRLAVVALAQIVWPVPTVAVVGGCATATLTVPASDVHPDTVTTTV